MVVDAVELASIPLLEFQVREACFGSSFIAGRDEVAGNVDAEDFGTTLGQREGCSTVADLDRGLEVAG